jgi:tetratricopeptide (TPR) repeat protein
VAVNHHHADFSQKAADLNQAGLQYYAGWEIERAIGAFQEAASLEPENPDYHLNMARAHARNGNYSEAMRSLGDYLHVETDEAISDRYERLFSSAFDEVETKLISGMDAINLSMELTGRAIQMWLEFRLTLGRQPLAIESVSEWAAALAYVTSRLNFLDLHREEFAAAFNADSIAVKEKSENLVETLDLIPADYRYFVGSDNPLDKVFEAAQQMKALDQGFEEEE